MRLADYFAGGIIGAVLVLMVGERLYQRFGHRRE